MIIVGFQKLVDPAHLPAKYRAAKYNYMRLEAPSDIKSQPTFNVRNQDDKQIIVPKLRRFGPAGKGNTFEIFHRKSNSLCQKLFFLLIIGATIFLLLL